MTLHDYRLSGTPPESKWTQFRANWLAWQRDRHQDPRYFRNELKQFSEEMRTNADNYAKARPIVFKHATRGAA